MVTIIDVARAAGVSKSTVSRVLDERLPPSNSPTAQRVRQAAADLGYVKDSLAAGLRRAGTSTIGVVVPRLTDTVMAMFFEAVAAAAGTRGLFALVATTDDDPGTQARAVEALLRRRVDGLVLTTSRITQDHDPGVAGVETAQDGIGASTVPLVLALREDGHCPAAVGDDELGAMLATRHLLDLGHRRIGLVGGPEYASSARGRRRGYQTALDRAGVGLETELIAGDAFSMQAGEEAGARLLTSAQPPSAIFAVNDNTAIGVMAAAHALGFQVPRDLSVVGYNDIPVVSRLPVPLTTVRVPFDQIAVNALDLLDQARRGEPARTLVSTPTLIPRETTAPPRESSLTL
ncbi:MAG: LacI family DNA-binding transcriptional regulator [Actinomycetales bacterium]